MIKDNLIHRPSNYYSFKPPEKGKFYTDPIFNTKIQRISNALITHNDSDTGNLDYIANEYSTICPFNNNKSLYILQHESYFALYNQYGTYIKNLPFLINASSQPRWSRTDYAIIYFLASNTLQQYNVNTDRIDLIKTFPEYQVISGKGEADISFDGNYLVLSGDDRHIFTYHIPTKTKSRILDVQGKNFDSIYITPHNNVTVTWNTVGTVRYSGIELFNLNMEFIRQLTRAGGHMDVTKHNTKECLIWCNSNDPNPVCANGIIRVDIATGYQTCLLSLDWNLGVHISCPDKNFAIVSTYTPSDPDPMSSNWHPYTNEVFKVPLNGTQASRFLHHRSRPYSSYNYMPKATVSRDGSRVIYTSNYGLQREGNYYPPEYVDAYIFNVPGIVGQTL